MPDATELQYESGVMPYTAVAQVSPGQMIQLADGRAAYHASLNNLTAGDRGGFNAQGLATITKPTGVVFLDGCELFWDHSANALALTPGSDKDFYVGCCVGDAATGDVTAVVNLNVQPSYIIDSRRDAFRSLLVGGVANQRIGSSQRFLNSTTAEAQKADILSHLGWAPSSKVIVDARVCIVTNGDAAALDFNVGVANATHATDADAITESLFMHVDGASTNINFESDDGTTEVAATDSTLDFTAGTPFLVTFDIRDRTAIKIYVNGVRVLSATTFTLAAATGPLKLLAHVEKTSDDSPGDFYIDSLTCRQGGNE